MAEFPDTQAHTDTLYSQHQTTLLQTTPTSEQLYWTTLTMQIVNFRYCTNCFWHVQWAFSLITNSEINLLLSSSLYITYVET